LIVGDRDVRQVPELDVQTLEVGDVQATVLRRHVRHGELASHGEVQVTEVEVHHVELGGTLMHALEEQHVVRHFVDAVLVEPEAPVRDGDETGARVRVARSEERHVVALADELLGQVRDDALRAAVVLGRDALV